MMELDQDFRHATPADAACLAEFVNIAGEGLPLYLWSRMAAFGQSPWDVGRERAAREEGGFSYRNAILRMEAGEVVSCLISYPLADEASGVDLNNLPPMFVPLQELEDRVAGTWYINVIATLPASRGHNHGGALLLLAENMARAANKRGMSLIVADSNERARNLYLRMGYREVGRRAMVKEQWQHPGTDWVLMEKILHRTS